MKQLLPFLIFFLSFWSRQPAMGQQKDCVLKSPVLHIHFGRGNVKDINATPPPNYGRVNSPCPIDGYYSYAPTVPGCNYGAWFTLTEDHTPGDKDGNMMIVNCYPGGGVFLSYPVKGIKGNTTYEFAIWMMNICRLDDCCSSLSPIVYASLTTPSGKKIATISIGQLPQTKVPVWRRFSGFFTVPAGEKELILRLQNDANGGCGNDMVLDDITFRECVKQAPAVTIPARQTPVASEKKPAEVKKPVKKQAGVTTPPVKNREKTVALTETKKEATTVQVKQPSTEVPVPLILRTRENTLAKQIETTAGEIRVDLYDNGEIDGDTVSIYHNNTMVVSEARLSQKPVTVRLTVDEAHPHHELVMVAENLGSIPPNTSLMIVTAKDKRYQVFITSSEQKNAKVNIDLKNQ